MKHITDKEIAKLLEITEKSYTYQGKTKERIELVCNELIKRMELAHERELKQLKEDVIKAVREL